MRSRDGGVLDERWTMIHTGGTAIVDCGWWFGESIQNVLSQMASSSEFGFMGRSVPGPSQECDGWKEQRAFLW